MTKNKLYTLVLVLSLLGYAWLGFQLYSEKTTSDIGQVCIFKTTTGLPCPSCGTTRSILEIFEGNIFNALYINPLGFLAWVCLFVFPCWILVDLLQKNNSFLKFYLQVERWISRQPVAIAFILLILVNWGWNIYKNL